jgi:methylglutaconyl-CoA hydratase
MTFQHLRLERDGPVVRLVLDRPAVRNAFDDMLVAELRACADRIARDPEGARVVVLSGAGTVFCAGGDLAWMRRTADFSRSENLADAERLGAMFDALDRLPVPLVGRIHGAALGGGAGLAAVCDIAVAASDAVFGFTEVKLGLVPGAISPYVLAKIGPSAARALFLTGAKFDAARALAIGLVHHVAPPALLDEVVSQVVNDLLSSGPEAIAAAKELIRQVPGAGDRRAASAIAAEAIAARRASEEGREGVGAFLERRRPNWTRQAD